MQRWLEKVAGALSPRTANGDGNGRALRHVTVELEVRGRGSLAELATELHGLDGIIDVRAGDAIGLSYWPRRPGC